MLLFSFGLMNTLGDRRNWTDDDLRSAISTSHSWRGVARALGLKGTSAGSIRVLKRHAERLGLDSAHFTGQRPWSDAQLRAAVPAATCWADLLSALGILDNGTVRTSVKGHAVRLGLDLTHFERPRDPVPDGELFDRPVQLTTLRYAASAVAMAWFTLRGCAVALPIEPQEYDLLVTTSNGVQRVQVKTCATRNKKKNYWHVGIGRRPYTLDKTASKMPYDPDTIDLFFILLGDGSIYLIPSLVVAGRISISAESYLPYRVGDASSLLQ
ncbi:group I intron-associated PD-(D/E)XK endonuclease [Kribbella sp. NBC_01505]|uniref:group I intron-associated PD-(D/E)XK endonuclease n=1 Tax=Kribbella sp. NBC_01505 TaxID=2903580 RepID=UPI00386BF861